jgi:hypothetical protein
LPAEVLVQLRAPRAGGVAGAVLKKIENFADVEFVNMQVKATQR